MVGEGLTYLLTGIDGRWWGKVDVEGGSLSALMGGGRVWNLTDGGGGGINLSAYRD